MRKLLETGRFAFRRIDEQQRRLIAVTGNFPAIQNHTLDRFPAALASGVAARDAKGNALKGLKVPARIEDRAAGFKPPAGAFAFIGTIIEANMKSGLTRQGRKFAHERSGRWNEINHAVGSVKKPRATIQNLTP